MTSALPTSFNDHSVDKNTLNASDMSIASFGVTSLDLRHFRNIYALTLDLSSSIVILTAPNGTGKTNILEALSLFSPGKGLRSAKFSDIQQKTMPQNENVSHALVQGWQVGLTLIENELPLQLGTVFMREGVTERRFIKCQGEFLKTQALLTDYLNVVWFTPSMGALFSESGQTQRQFVDRLVFAFDPLHAKRRTHYDKVMRERNTILKEHGASLHGSWLDPIEATLSELGYDIIDARSKALYAIESLQSTTPLFPRFTATMEGECETLYQHISQKPSCIQAFQEHLRQNRSLDALKGSTGMGPHRSHFHVIHKGKEISAEFCSTGEQKMLVLAIILAFVKMESSTGLLLLLDDVVDHLDEQHRSVLLHDIMQLTRTKKCQVWLTGTNPLVFKVMDKKAQFLNAAHLT